MNFNPIIVLFLTFSREMNIINIILFQSYYSLISNKVIKMLLEALTLFQSYYSLISNRFIGDIMSSFMYFNPIIVLFLT